MQSEPCELRREGYEPRLVDAFPAPFYVVPVQRPSVAASLGPSLPAEVLLDRFNPKFDHYFPEVEVQRDWYRLSDRQGGVWIYEYSHTDSRKVRVR